MSSPNIRPPCARFRALEVVRGRIDEQGLTRCAALRNLRGSLQSGKAAALRPPPRHVQLARFTRQQPLVTACATMDGSPTCTARTDRSLHGPRLTPAAGRQPLRQPGIEAPRQLPATALLFIGQRRSERMNRASTTRFLSASRAPVLSRSALRPECPLAGSGVPGETSCE